jgi:hypothetical protein
MTMTDVQKRIVSTIKIFDEEYNRNYVGNPYTGLTRNMQYLSETGTMLLIWLGYQELWRGIPHLKYAYMIGEWLHDMFIKNYVYYHLDPKKLSDVQALLKEWQSFETRSKPEFVKYSRDSIKGYTFPYRKFLDEIWTGDPDLTANTWKKVFPD